MAVRVDVVPAYAPRERRVILLLRMQGATGAAMTGEILQQPGLFRFIWMLLRAAALAHWYGFTRRDSLATYQA